MDLFFGFLEFLLFYDLDAPKEPQAQHSILLSDIKIVKAKALEKFQNPSQANKWMHSSFIDGLSPWELCIQKRTPEVLAFLGKDNHV